MYIFVAMRGHLMLAALDWNRQNRNPIMTQEGTTKVDVVYSKKRKDFVLKQRFEINEDLHVPILVQRIFNVQAVWHLCQNHHLSSCWLNTRQGLKSRKIYLSIQLQFFPTVYAAVSSSSE